VSVRREPHDGRTQNLAGIVRRIRRGQHGYRSVHQPFVGCDAGAESLQDRISGFPGGNRSIAAAYPAHHFVEGS
jgi:hypothetical protein